MLHDTRNEGNAELLLAALCEHLLGEKVDADIVFDTPRLNVTLPANVKLTKTLLRVTSRALVGLWRVVKEPPTVHFTPNPNGANRLYDKIAEAYSKFNEDRHVIFVVRKHCIEWRAKKGDRTGSEPIPDDFDKQIPYPELERSIMQATRNLLCATSYEVLYPNKEDHETAKDRVHPVASEAVDTKKEVQADPVRATEARPFDPNKTPRERLVEALKPTGRIEAGDEIIVDGADRGEVFIASGHGFGCHPDARGTAIFGEWKGFEGVAVRIERYQILSINGSRIQ